jgi:hypothetical protein
MKTLIAATVLAYSSLASAGTDWIVIPAAGAERTFLDRASFVEGATLTGVTVLRSYDQTVTLGDDAQTGEILYPHRSAKVRYAVDCASRTVGMESWELYSGNLGDGKIVWADTESGERRMSKPSTTEEIVTYNAVCSPDVALRQVVRHYATLAR